MVSTKVFSQGTRLGISSSGEYVDKQTIDVANQGKESKPTQKIIIHQESAGSMTPKTLSTENTKSPDHKSSVIIENSKTSPTTETKDTLEIDNDANTGPNNLDSSTTASLPTTLCECPTTSTTSKQSTTPGIRTTSGTCICPDSIREGKRSFYILPAHYGSFYFRGDSDKYARNHWEKEKKKGNRRYGSVC